MPYGLLDLANNKSSIVFSSPLGEKLRSGSSVEEQASFLVQWAAELYSDWATWMNYILPGCKTSYRRNTLRIVDSIKRNNIQGQNHNNSDSWSNITGMLRASYSCNNE